MKLNKLSKTTMSLAAFAGLSLSANAAIIAFEAESGTLGADFDPALADATALGGFYITTETNESSASSPLTDVRTVNYSLNVPAGTYDVYVRARIAVNNSDDSFFYAKAFGDANPAVVADWQLMNNLSGWGLPWAQPFEWSDALASTVTSAGGTVQWEIGAREDGFDMDAFALVSTGQSVTDIELDNAVTIPVAVPEPSTTALLGLGGLALAFRRRK